MPEYMRLVQRLYEIRGYLVVRWSPDFSEVPVVGSVIDHPIQASALSEYEELVPGPFFVERETDYADYKEQSVVAGRFVLNTPGDRYFRVLAE